ncbi:glycoside hydrolase family 3 protein [Actinocatenispora rupis]|uniref:beta-N-acetylhexosaminidase n=1 Tax=Actinocatenispora rupis TaxID=519421 RepID=A0A8J3NC61_9ACTN|nr:glycoside hydrolase family 3 protein [Actinocatenispora rupis]GID13746.1 beta-N-acetylhexosaminidase [Actinocatenispora rupis]
MVAYHRQADEVLGRISVTEKIGQLFVVPVGRHSPNALRLPPDQRTGSVANDGLGQVLDQIRTYRVGGVCYFPTRAEGDEPGEVAALLAEVAAVADGGVRPVVSVDQEGGTVARLRRGVTSVPSAMGLAATGDPASAERAAGILGAELRAVGFHQDYAPDADVNSNPANPVIGVRSYSADPAEVARYVAAAVRGLRGAGLAATAKHFPGHGDTSTDSHLTLPSVTRTAADWDAIDLVPFGAAIEAGVDAVMSAHVAVPVVDPSGDPATASAPILTGVLRDRLGFAGVAVTDALDMAGARDRLGDGEIAVRALLAGADQLLMSADLPVAVTAVGAAVASGRVPVSRLDEAVRRILVMKARLGLLGADAGTPAGADPLAAAGVDVAANAVVARDLARRALTVLGDPGWRVPAGRVALVGNLAGVEDVLLPVLRGAGAEVTVVDSGSDPSTVDTVLAAAAGADVTVAVTRGAVRWPGQRALLAGLAAAGHRHVLVALREPYDAGLAPAAVARFLTYGDNEVMREALVDVLRGDAVAGGRLPVDVPDADGGVAYRKGAGA